MDSSSLALSFRRLKATAGRVPRHSWFSFIRTSSPVRTVRRIAATASRSSRPRASPISAPLQALRKGRKLL